MWEGNDNISYTTQIRLNDRTNTMTFIVNSTIYKLKKYKSNRIRHRFVLQSLALAGTCFVQIGLGVEMICSTVIIGALSNNKNKNEILTLTSDQESWFGKYANINLWPVAPNHICLMCISVVKYIVWLGVQDLSSHLRRIKEKCSMVTCSIRIIITRVRMLMP